MIVTRVDGGLGNQMFQYAFGRYLANKHQTELLLDTSSYQSGPAHGFLLDKLSIEAKSLTSEQAQLVPRKYGASRAAGSRIEALRSSLFSRPLARCKEKSFGFDQRYLRTRDRKYLVGYWQSEQFFPGMRAQLIREFTPRSVSNVSRKLADEMEGSESIALHVRRGDYLSNSGAARLYVNLSLDYYRRCYADWRVGKREPRVYVFSNDQDWCRGNLHLDAPIHYVDHNSGETAHEDMWLMSRASCCVIANSTFSWWAAWLNERPQKVVYAPDAWFQSGTMDDSAILCPDWRRMHIAVDRVECAA
ncbi:MAG: alpha-1,2-fucosyltransferase [Pirellulaceae bacterium]